jgi:hypothetical protein
LKTPGLINGELPENTDAFKFHRFFSIAKASSQFQDPHAIVFLHDADSDDERRRELLELNDLYGEETIPVIVGVPHPETECWLLAGYRHDITEEESARLDEYKRETGGVDPCSDSHRLNARNETDVRHPKCALRTLCPTEIRQNQCLEAPFALLELHGHQNGLKDFLEALRARLIPGLFGGAAEQPR